MTLVRCTMVWDFLALDFGFWFGKLPLDVLADFS